MRRTIELEIREHHPFARHAMGYLTTWGLSGYTEVRIFEMGKDDLIAHYTNPETQAKFTIGAIWDHQTGRYSFHS